MPRAGALSADSRKPVIRLSILLCGVLAALAAMGVLTHWFIFATYSSFPETWQAVVARCLSRTVDGPAYPFSYAALLGNLALLLLFGLQHSIMARAGFQRWLARLMPTPLHRSTYAMAAAIVLEVTMVFWQPIDGCVWDLKQSPTRWAVQSVFWTGLFVAFAGVVAMRSSDLTGMTQIQCYLRGEEYESKPLSARGPYRLVRHPMWLGTLFLLWATPTLTLGRLIMAAGLTVYILIAAPLAERDLLRQYGNAYRAYQSVTPRWIPRLGWHRKQHD